MLRTLAAGVLHTTRRYTIDSVLPRGGQIALMRHTADLCAANRLFRRLYHPSAICERTVSKKKKKTTPKEQRNDSAQRDRGILEKYGFKADVQNKRGTLENTVRPTFAQMEWPQDADIDERFAIKIRGQRLDKFCKSADALQRCAYFGVTEGEFNVWSDKFRTAVLDERIERMKPSAIVPLLIRSRTEGLDNYIVNQFFGFLERDAPDVVKDIKYLRKITDLRFPQEWALSARNIRRKIIMHVGPTNSGKTYHALQRLKVAEKGVYCSPLRLLAYEVYNRMMASGISCALITGEDKRYPDYANSEIQPIGYTTALTPITQVVSCTVEMMPMEQFNVAVIDEIQMISDRQRGWAWTSALMSLRARELHLCGEPSAVPLVKRICEMMDEDVEVREYKRLGELEVSKQSLGGDWRKIRKGDCVVVFSRAEIYGIKKTIEQKTGMRCAVIYGTLPPESRVRQAELFNDPDSGYDVLVASDAVGMGINLSINRVVFTTLEKFDGEGVRPISVSQTRQIGGRAGRYNSGVNAGTVTTMEAQDIGPLAVSMARMPPNLDAAGIKPTTSMIEMFSHQFPRVQFSQLWSMFRDISNVEDDYFLCGFNDQEEVAKVIENLPLSVSERYNLIYAPVNTRDEIGKACLRKYATAIAFKRECNIADVVKLPPSTPRNREELRLFEQWHRGITTYTWLSYHYATVFTKIDEAFAIKKLCEDRIQEGLVSLHGPGNAGTRGDAAAQLKKRDNSDIRKALGIF